jgi:hypothetical protein
MFAAHYTPAMELSAVFETWHLGDGNYPPLKNGQLVNLSFEVCPDELKLAESSALLEFRHFGEARYEFTGTVLRVYREDGRKIPIVVIETGHFRFYVFSELAATFNPGDVINGRGTLLFDHYIWVESLSSYPDPPDLFYKLRVSGIWLRRLPERFIRRSGRGVAYPTRVQPEDYEPNDMIKVGAVSNEDLVDYVIQFSDRDIPDEPIVRTFDS